MKMEVNPSRNEFELIYVIVNFGLGSKVVKIAKNNGVTGGTVFLGKGTMKNHLLEILDLCDIRKEIVLLVADKDTANKALESLNNELKLYKPNHGIAFSSSLTKIVGIRKFSCNKDNNDGGAMNMYNAIFVVVDKGKAENVIDSATKAGSRGGTIINARGSGIHETSKLFSMEIEPEKEIVLILSDNQSTDNIIASIKEDLKIEEPGNGIIFVQDVSKTYGLY